MKESSCQLLIQSVTFYCINHTSLTSDEECLLPFLFSTFCFLPLEDLEVRQDRLEQERDLIGRVLVDLEGSDRELDPV